MLRDCCSRPSRGGPVRAARAVEEALIDAGLQPRAHRAQALPIRVLDRRVPRRPRGRRHGAVRALDARRGRLGELPRARASGVRRPILRSAQRLPRRAPRRRDEARASPSRTSPRGRARGTARRTATPIFSPASRASFSRNSSKNAMPSESWLAWAASASTFVWKWLVDVLVGGSARSSSRARRRGPSRRRGPRRGARRRSAGCRRRGTRRRARSAGAPVIGVVVVAVLEEHTRWGRRTARSRRGPRGSVARPPRGRPACSRAPRRASPGRDAGEARGPRPPPPSPPGASRASAARSSAGRCEPRSPFVRTSRWTSRPAAAHFASVPPAQISASSGCAKTASTGPGRRRRGSSATTPRQPRGRGRTERACAPARRWRRAARGRPDRSRNAGPAMSRCTHGVSPTNSARNSAAVMAPP